MNILGVFKDVDNSIKTVCEENKRIIEITLLQNKKSMDVVCAPTHHFCNLGCKMCHLTNNRLNKKMIPIQINDFIEALSYGLRDNGKRRTENKKLLISFMGVGEPLLNLELLKSLALKRDLLCKQLGYNHIGFALATMMPNQNLNELAQFMDQHCIPFKVHFSLHSPIDAKRKELIPSTKVSIEEAFYLLHNYDTIISKNEYIQKEWKHFHKTDRVTEIHYTLIDQVNDTLEDLNRLTELLSTYQFSIKFIRFNPKENLYISKKEEDWVNYLKENGIYVKTYCPPGKNIGSSCGEFTKHYYHEEIETQEEYQNFLDWQKKYSI